MRTGRFIEINFNILAADACEKREILYAASSFPSGSLELTRTPDQKSHSDSLTSLVLVIQTTAQYLPDVLKSIAAVLDSLKTEITVKRGEESIVFKGRLAAKDRESLISTMEAHLMKVDRSAEDNRLAFYIEAIRRE